MYPDGHKYDKRYSTVSLPDNDWLIQRSRLASLIIRELDITAQDSVLDIGCDDGAMQRAVAERAREVVGIDVNRAAVEEASKYPEGHLYPLGCKSVRALVMDATAMDFAPETFDKVYSSHTIEHIRDLSSVFREVDRVLKPGGLVFFIYPWELWRGMAHARGAWKVCGNPFLGYKFHVHRLNPKKIIRFASGTRLRHLRSSLVFMRTPQWTTLFEKQP